MQKNAVQILRFARDLALEDLHIEEVGCLGELKLSYSRTTACLSCCGPGSHSTVWA